MAAEYPAAVKSFTTLIDGTDYPQVTHLHQVYDEVTAMQQALITNGLAHTLKLVHATHDIGASASTFAPRDLFLTRNAVIGTSLSVPSLITASGAMTVTPAAGSNLNVALSTTGDFAVNTDDLYVDTSTGNVGIGTTAPGNKFEISADAASTNRDINQLNIVGATDQNQNLQIGYQTTGDYGFLQSVKWGTSQTALALQPVGGNVGIGTTDPKSKLHIDGASGWIIQDEQDANVTATELDADDSIAIYSKADTFVIAYNNGGTITYITIPLDGSTTTWTHGTSAP